MFDVIIYHNNCLDGFSSYFCFWKFELLNKNYLAIPDKPSATHCPNNIEGKDIIIVDVAYKIDVLLEIINKAKSVLFIDHHITIIDEIKNIKDDKFKFIYDINECGASLSWKYCTDAPTVAGKAFQAPMPLVIQLVKDNDLGLWKIPDTKPFVAAVRFHFNITSSAYKNLKKFNMLLDDQEVKKITEIGKYYVVYKNYIIKDAVAGCVVKKFKFESKIYNVGVINTKTNLNSEIATEIAKIPGIDFSILWYYNHRKKLFILSLRSTKVNVGNIAKSYGGGGHKLASSFTTTTFVDDILE